VSRRFSFGVVFFLASFCSLPVACVSTWWLQTLLDYACRWLPICFDSPQPSTWI
jgi:hypothetical protein